MHIYAFGSICRGDIEPDSDIDLLAIVEGHDTRFDPEKYSIYSYARIEQMWSNGNPFAWHLALESRLLFASNNLDFLTSLGEPARYSGYVSDCEKFLSVFLEARSSLLEGSTSRVFDLSSVFLGIRNIATCFALGVLQQPDFSRHSARRLPGDFRIPVSQACYRILERSRILSHVATGRT